MLSVKKRKTEVPAEATDSPIWGYLQKRGKVDINNGCSNNAAPLNIYYEIYGSGTERVVFVNGMGVDRQMWEANVERFMKLSNYECLVYDHQGTGYSDTSGRSLSFTTSALAADLRKLMLALKWEKANIVAVSMGGMVALKFACSNSEMVKTLTLCATSAKHHIPPLTSIFDNIRIVFSRKGQAKFRNVCLSQYTREHLLSPAPKDTDCKNMLDYYLSVSKRNSKYKKRMSKCTVLKQLVAVFCHSISSSRLAHLGESLPDRQILVVVGARDRVIDPTDSEHLTKCIGHQHVVSEVYDDAAHALNSQECARFVQSIDSMICKYNALEK